MKPAAKLLSRLTGIILLALLLVSSYSPTLQAGAPLPQNPQSGSVGVQGQISAPPPTQGATISLPRDGQTFTTLPITVSGICPKGLLVKLFKNNVFSGSADCKTGSFTIIIDLFSGRNELLARVYDSLDQAGPDSNTVVANFNNSISALGAQVSLTSSYAKRGANPGQSLTWPIILSGGTGPYAVSVDWGDGKTPDLISQPFPGTFDIKHTYDNAGVYNVIVKVSDKSGGTAFLQLVGVANGPLGQDNTSSAASATNSSQNGGGTGTTKTKILWQPAAILLPLILATFWLGKRYEIKTLRKKIERGDRPFK